MKKTYKNLSLSRILLVLNKKRQEIGNNTVYCHENKAIKSIFYQPH